MSWTTLADLRAQVQKLWDKGELLRPTVSGQPWSPRRLPLSGPTSTELTERFDEVRAWLAELQACQPHLRLVLRTFSHRVLGVNALPDQVWLDSPEHALALVGKQKDAKRFTALVEQTRTQQPALLPWLEQHPLQALALAAVWPRLLALVAWLQAHVRPGIYLRQVDLAGVDSKFIEAHRGVLAELWDLTLPAGAVDASASGVGQFCRRYGFWDKPLRIRLRLLDAQMALLPQGCEQDLSVTQATFARLALPLKRVFITENEVNFLAFPALPESLVIFGAGYGFEALAGAAWLQRCRIHYWGDIDTHGFAILDQLRAQLPQVQSLLMDRATLLAHRTQWGNEPKPLTRELPRLSTDEAALFDDLRWQRLGQGVRLEQERIGFGWLQQALAALPTDSGNDRFA